jgi:hypothetical protein
LTKEEILRTIRVSKGISETELMHLNPEGSSVVLEEHLQALINSGDIGLWEKKYCPVCRDLTVISKEQKEIIDEIELPGLSIEEIKKVLVSEPNDPLFFNGYSIDEAQIGLFANFKHIDFDFEKYDYQIWCWIDNGSA